MFLVEAGKRAVEMQRFFNSFLNKGLHGAFTEHRQHMVIEAAAKSFNTGKTYTGNNHRFPIQYMNVGMVLNYLPYQLMAALFMVVVSQHTNHRYRA